MWYKELEWRLLSVSRPQLMKQRSAGMTDSDKIFLPPSALEELSNETGVEYPLNFEIRCHDVGTKTYVGVLEFSAPEGQVLLPEKVREDLDLPMEQLAGGGTIAIRYVSLPKATRLKLQPMTADFLDIPDHKSTLESVLRTHYTSLSAGDILKFFYEGKQYQIIVAEIAPSGSDAVSIINTDCEVEFVEPMNLGASDGRQFTRKLERNTGCVGKLSGFDKSNFYKISLSETDIEAAKSMDQGQGEPSMHTKALQIKLVCPKGDADMYVSLPPETHPGLVSHQWAMNNISGGQIIIKPGDFGIAAKQESTEEREPSLMDYDRDDEVQCFEWIPSLTMYIGITSCDPSSYGGQSMLDDGKASAGFQYSGGSGQIGSRFSSGKSSQGDSMMDGKSFETEYELEWSIIDTDSKTMSLHASSARIEEAVQAGYKRCPNCGTVVPESRFTMHEAYCSRHNVKCSVDGCDFTMRKGSAEEQKHMLEHKKKEFLYESAMLCDCGETLPNLSALTHHKREACPERLVVCRFCGNRIRAGSPPEHYGDRSKGLTGHESYCGSRTIDCGICGQRVQMKVMDVHCSVLHSDRTVAEAMAAPSRPEQTANNNQNNVTGSADTEIAGGEVLWTCRNCTYQNDGCYSRCQMCNEPRTEAQAYSTRALQARSSSAMDLDDESMSDEQPEPSIQSGGSCANEVCTLRAERLGDAAIFRLCNRCFRIIVVRMRESTDSENDGIIMDKERLIPYLANRYQQQLTTGCGKVSCTNLCCKSGRGGSGFDNATAATIAEILADKARDSDGDPHYYICVTLNEKPQAFQVVELPELAVGNHTSPESGLNTSEERDNDMNSTHDTANESRTAGQLNTTTRTRGGSAAARIAGAYFG